MKNAEIVSGVVSNVVSALVKWLWSLKSTTKTGTDLSILVYPFLFSFIIFGSSSCFGCLFCGNEVFFLSWLKNFQQFLLAVL